MAFNFNWSPLIADTSRARDMLTAALNKSPKPPIIVDDILVTELNLGSVPPELEILEIGDLAEDRFRGIFKMSYAGDAVLTLRTRVQANPLNTYLSTKPSFASPEPLAASSGLTIPLQITLSDIRLSGFVILVFSRQKGITLVFRNDPLEALKVSSTFDSIPFVRDYLQNEIEGQLRVLFMEDLPAIIHRLSLRLFVPEHADLDSATTEPAAVPGDQEPIDPLASPAQRPVDSYGQPQSTPLTPSDPSSTTHASFSQKNLLRLATLTDSYSTLSLFTPPIRDTVFRSWAAAYSSAIADPHAHTFRPSISPHAAAAASSASAAGGITLASLARNNYYPPVYSRASSVTSTSISVSESSVAAAQQQPQPPQPSSRRPSATALSSYHSVASFGSSNSGAIGRRNNSFIGGGGGASVGGASGSGVGGAHNRKRRHRVINLRKTSVPESGGAAAATAAGASEGNASERPTTPTSVSGGTSASSWDRKRQWEREGEMQTPPASPAQGRTPRPRPGERLQNQRIAGREERWEEEKGTRPSMEGRTIFANPAPQEAAAAGAKVDPEGRRGGERPPVQMAREIEGPAEAAGAGENKATGATADKGRRPRPQPQPPTRPTGPQRAQSADRRMGAGLGDTLAGLGLGLGGRGQQGTVPAMGQNGGGAGVGPGSEAAAPGGGILEQAWMVKMATEIARRVADEKDAAAAAAAAGGSRREGRDDEGEGNGEVEEEWGERTLRPAVKTTGKRAPWDFWGSEAGEARRAGRAGTGAGVWGGKGRGGTGEAARERMESGLKLRMKMKMRMRMRM